MRYDYYDVSVPGDAADSIQALAHLAIQQAEKRTRLYCLPADWSATHVGGQVGDYEVTFRVRRKRCA